MATRYVRLGPAIVNSPEDVDRAGHAVTMTKRTCALLHMVATASLCMTLVVGIAACSSRTPRQRPANSTTFAFDCKPPRPVAHDLGETLCIGTDRARRRFKTLLAIPSSGTTGSPRWSPDGQRLLVRIELSQGAQQRDDVGMINADGSAFVDLTNEPTRPSWGADWSPDGRQVVFNRASPFGPGQQLWVMNADGSSLHRITTTWGEYPAWSPDGQLIAFQSNRCACDGPRGAEYDIYTIRPDGSGLHRLTSYPGEESVVGWSRDSRLLAYARDPDADPGIWLVPRKGGVARHLQPRAPGVQLRGATWGRDGSFLFYAIGRPTGATKAGIAMTDREFVYQVSADGRTVRRLLSDAEGADPRPTGTGKTISSVDLAHRWLGARAQLEVSGRLLVAGSGASGEAINLGLLGSQLPTRRFATVETGPDGRFRIRLRMPARAEPTWRFVTAFFSGSRTAWSTTAFSALGP